MNDQVPLLPATYYLEHYHYLLDFVQQYYGSLLSTAEQAFIKNFGKLPMPARCLYIRLINRRTLYYKAVELEYAEIPDIQQALDELVTAHFAYWITAESVVEIERLLSIFNKQELLQFCQRLNLDIKKSTSKQELIGHLVHDIESANLLQIIAKDKSLLTPAYQGETQMLRFLFFGNLHSDMTRFVVKDLGHVKLPEFVPESFTARYSCRQAIEDCLAVQLAYADFKALQTTAAPWQTYQWFKAWYQEHVNLHPEAQHVFTKLLLRLAKYLEQAKLWEEAVEVYTLTKQPPSLERQIRLLTKLGKTEQAKLLCEHLISNSQNAKEYYFANDFYQKLAKAAVPKATTRYLQTAQIIELTAIEQTIGPEQAVMQYLLQQGQQVMFTENYLWRGLFGLLFWDIVFDPGFKTFHQPFQIAPSDLYQPDFYKIREQKILARLKLLHDSAKCLTQLRLTYEANYNVANPMISWHERLWESVERCCAWVSPPQLSAVLLEMAKDWRHNSCGFPDLLSWNQKSYCFIEVKSPNDQLSAQQLKWQEFFARIGIHSQVIRIKQAEI